jgi:PTH1 family peptidyl-tRNA hydrolase
VKLIVGLGNPGARYEQTRHNVGFLVVERLAARYSITIGRQFCAALVGEGVGETTPIILAKPLTYMNRSGEAVSCLLRERALTAADLVIVNDDLDLPFGRIRMRPSGSAAGHRGLMSVSEALTGEPFLRVRVGISRPPESCSVTDYVLDNFAAEELEHLGKVVERAADAIGCLLRDGIERAMASYNRYEL